MAGATAKLIDFVDQSSPCMGFGKDKKGAIIREADVISLGTLANASAVKQTSPLAITDDFRIIKSEYAAALTVLGAVDDLPIHLYLVNDDLSVADIASAIVAQGPLNRSDRDRDEAAMRFVKYIGSFMARDSAPVVGGDYPLLGPQGQQGQVSETIRWTFSKGTGWSLAAFNNSGGALVTGAVVRFVATHYGVWVG